MHYILVDLVMIGLVLCLPEFMVYYRLSPGFIFSYLSTDQEIGWKERLRYDLYCVEWHVKPQLNQSVVCVFLVQYREDSTSLSGMLSLIDGIPLCNCVNKLLVCVYSRHLYGSGKFYSRKTVAGNKIEDHF